MKRTINLLSPSQRMRTIICSRLVMLEIGLLLFSASLVGGFLWRQDATLTQQVLQLEQAQKQLEPVRMRRGEMNRLQQDITKKQQLYAAWENQTASTDAVLLKIAGAMPPGVWLKEIKQPEKEQIITLKGFALTMDDITRLVERLTVSPIFEGAEIKDVSRDKQQMLQFAIVLKEKR